MTDEEYIKDMYSRYWDYMITKDDKGLRSLMSDDYTLLHMTGVKQGADEFIKGLVNGTFNYFSAEHDLVTVVIFEDEAVMTGKSRVLAAVYGGGKHKWQLRGDYTFRKENGNWKLTSSRASTY